MWIIALEALVALSLLLLIVWLTMGGSRRRDTDEQSQNEPKALSDQRDQSAQREKRDQRAQREKRDKGDQRD
jgi:hypothetical protein